MAEGGGPGGPPKGSAGARVHVRAGLGSGRFPRLWQLRPPPILVIRRASNLGPQKTLSTPHSAFPRGASDWLPFVLKVVPFGLRFGAVGSEVRLRLAAVMGGQPDPDSLYGGAIAPYGLRWMDGRTARRAPMTGARMSTLLSGSLSSY